VLKPLNYGFKVRLLPTSISCSHSCKWPQVEREYSAAEKPEHVRRDENGVWHFKLGRKVTKLLQLLSVSLLGAQINVKLTMTTVQRRYHIGTISACSS